jgi:iron complex transport system permease protein
VLVAGAIGFVGLVVPHALRLAGVSDHRRLVPLAALGGGALLTAADTVARSVVAPLEFPVGAITALVGVPVLLALLVRSR